MIPTKREASQGDLVGNRATVHEVRHVHTNIHEFTREPPGPRPLGRATDIASKSHTWDRDARPFSDATARICGGADMTTVVQMDIPLREPSVAAVARGSDAINRSRRIQVVKRPPRGVSRKKKSGRGRC